MIGKTNSQTGGAIKGEKLNISLTSNQTSHSDLLGAIIKVSHLGGVTEYAWEGHEITVNIPPYVEYSVEYTSVNGYKTPETFVSTAVADNSRTITAEYKTCVLSVVIVDNQSSLNDIASVKAAVKGTTVNASLSSGGSVKVPFGESVTITGPALSGYATPSAVSYTSADANKSVTLIYDTTLVTVEMADNQAAYDDIASATATVAASGITTQTVKNGDVVKVPTGASCTITWSALTGYKTPSAQTFTASGSAVSKTGTYQTEVVSVSLSSDNDSSVNGVSVTINGKTSTWNGTTITQKVAFGTSYSVSVGELEGYVSPESKLFTADSASRYVDMQYKFNPVKDLSMFDIYGNAINQTTANCYVVKEAGVYKIPLVFGNAIKNGQVNTASFTNNGGAKSHDFVNYLGNAITSPYIETDTGSVATSVQMSISDTENAVTNLGFINGDGCKYISFSVPSVPKTGGNAVISVKDADGVIMWSWHIWLWEDDLTPVEITNATSVAYNIMPVNLGSKWDEESKTHIKNWFYQFGRPNPMLCPSAYNSTSDHVSYGSLGFTITSAASHLYKGIQNPTTFFKYDGSYHAWFAANSGKTYNLWDAACTSFGNSDNNVVKTVYDPCPIGFKMPNGNMFTGLSIISKANRIVKFTRYSGDSTGVGFPMSGYRNFSDGLLSSVGSYGYVWLSSAYSQYYAFYLNFNSSNVNPQDSLARAYGFSVRPVQDTGVEGQNKLTKIRINQTITDPEAMITRIVDEGGIEAIRANSHRYTGTFANGVMTLKQLDDTDGTKYADGTTATLTTIGTDVWMKLPQFHWKCSQYATDIWDFEVVYGAKPDDTYKTWDGNDLIGAYEAYNSSNKSYSVSGKDSTGNVHQKNFKTYAQARGEGFSLVKWKHHCMMAMLYYTMYGNTNCQAKIGKGTSSYTKATGATNSLGMTDTVAGGNGDSNSINFWGLENWWGNKIEWVDNVAIDAGVWKVTEDDGTVRQAGTGGSSNGWISKLLLGENIDLIPTATSGSETTGFCDYYAQLTNNNNSIMFMRSYSEANTYCGVACAFATQTYIMTASNRGSRLAFRGNIVIE